MSSWIRAIQSTLTPADHSPVAQRGLIRAMTMPPISPSSGEAGGVTMRSKDGKERDPQKRFSFFGKKK